MKKSVIFVLYFLFISFGFANHIIIPYNYINLENSNYNNDINDTKFAITNWHKEDFAIKGVETSYDPAKYKIDDLASADIDGDGEKDILFLDDADNAIYIKYSYNPNLGEILDYGANSYDAKISNGGSPIELLKLAIADLDNDGKDDLVLIYIDNNNYQYGIGIIYGMRFSGEKNITAETDFDTYITPEYDLNNFTGLIVADVDYDGTYDLIFADDSQIESDQIGARVYIIKGQGSNWRNIKEWGLSTSSNNPIPNSEIIKISRPYMLGITDSTSFYETFGKNLAFRNDLGAKYLAISDQYQIDSIYNSGVHLLRLFDANDSISWGSSIEISYPESDFNTAHGSIYAFICQDDNTTQRTIGAAIAFGVVNGNSSVVVAELGDGSTKTACFYEIAMDGIFSATSEIKLVNGEDGGFVKVVYSSSVVIASGERAKMDIKIADADKDGMQDLFLSVPVAFNLKGQNSVSNVRSGAVYFFPGESPPSMTMVSLDSNALLTIYGENGSSSFGNSMMLSDFDGDGFLELYVAAGQFDANYDDANPSEPANYTGKIYGFYLRRKTQIIPPNITGYGEMDTAGPFVEPNDGDGTTEFNILFNWYNDGRIDLYPFDLAVVFDTDDVTGLSDDDFKLSLDSDVFEQLFVQATYNCREPADISFQVSNIPRPMRGADNSDFDLNFSFFSDGNLLLPLADNKIVYHITGDGGNDINMGNEYINLSFTGEPGFIKNAVDPDVGLLTETFKVRIKYTNNAPDSTHLLPTVHDLLLYVDYYDNTTETHSYKEIKLTMNEVDSSDTDVTDGKVYECSFVPENLSELAGIDYEPHFTYVFDFQDNEGHHLNTVFFPSGTSPAVIGLSQTFFVAKISEYLVVYNYVDRGHLNIIIPEMFLIPSDYFDYQGDDNGEIYISVSPELPNNSLFKMVPMVFNPTHPHTDHDDMPYDIAFVAPITFTRFNFLTMAPENSYTITFKFYRNGKEIPYDGFPVIELNNSIIYSNTTQVLGDFTLKNDASKPLHAIVNSKNTHFDIIFAESKLKGVKLFYNNDMGNKDAIYIKDGKKYKYIGKNGVNISQSGEYIILTDKKAPLFNKLFEKNGYLFIDANDDLSGIAYYKISFDGKSYISKEGRFRLDIFNQGVNSIKLSITDNVGNIYEKNITYDLKSIPVVYKYDKKIMNYPNPFNPSTTVELNIEKRGYVKVVIFNVKGRAVKTLFAGIMTEGVHKLYWDGKDENSRTLSSGIYYVKVMKGKKVFVHKMVLLK